MNKTTLIACCASAIAGGYVTHLYYSAEIAGMQREQAEAVQKEQTTHAAKLAAATDTILLAQSEYDAVRSERDRLLAGLRDNNARRSDQGDTVETLRARVARCERMVSRLAEAGSRCGDGWQRCAAKHDALAEAVR